MEIEETLSQPQTDLSRTCAPSIDQCQLDYAAVRARILFGCYRKGDANDPETYTAAITAILAEYEPEVIQRVTDPRTGIPRQLKFMAALSAAVGVMSSVLPDFLMSSNDSTFSFSEISLE